NGADAEAATPHAKSASASAHSATVTITTVVDVVAAAKIIITHGVRPCVQIDRDIAATRRHQRKISTSLINSLPGNNCLARSRQRVLETTVTKPFTAPVPAAVARISREAIPQPQPR